MTRTCEDQRRSVMGPDGGDCRGWFLRSEKAVFERTSICRGLKVKPTLFFRALLVLLLVWEPAQHLMLSTSSESSHRCGYSALTVQAAEAIMALFPAAADGQPDNEPPPPCPDRLAAHPVAMAPPAPTSPLPNKTASSPRLAPLADIAPRHRQRAAPLRGPPAL